MSEIFSPDTNASDNEVMDFLDWIWHSKNPYCYLQLLLLTPIRNSHYLDGLLSLLFILILVFLIFSSIAIAAVTSSQNLNNAELAVLFAIIVTYFTDSF